MSSAAHVTTSHSSREQLGLLLGFVGMVIFGGTLPATRLAVSAIDPVALTALRTAIAGVCSLALLLVLRRPFLRRGRCGRNSSSPCCASASSSRYSWPTACKPSMPRMAAWCSASCRSRPRWWQS